jgi:hypothetical protein
LRYIVEIWEQHEKQKWPGKLLPLVIPIVVCHCNGICNFDNSMKEMVAIINGTEKMVPDFCFLKLDLWFLEPVQIEDGTDGYWGGKGKLKVFLLALKHSRRPEVLSVLHRIIRIAEEARESQKWDYDYLDVVLLYLGSVIDENLYEQYCRIIAQEHSGGEKYMGTIADKLRREERLKRETIERELRKEIEQKNTELRHKDFELEKEKAELEKKETELEKKDEQLHQIIQLMLKKGVDPQSIRKIRSLSDEEIEQIIKEVNGS